MKKKKEPQPYFFTSIPKKKLDKLLKGDEDKPMTKKTEQTSEKKDKSAKEVSNTRRYIQDDRRVG